MDGVRQEEMEMHGNGGEEREGNMRVCGVNRGCCLMDGSRS